MREGGGRGRGRRVPAQGSCPGASHLRPLDDDGVRGEVDTPCEGGCRHEHLDVTVGEEILHEGAVAVQRGHGVRG